MDYITEAKKPRIKPEDIRWHFDAERKRRLRVAKRFIITSAMNNCQVNAPFWTSIKRYAAANEAEIIVIPVRYKNPTSQGENARQKIQDAWWPPELHEYLTDDAIQLHHGFWLMAHVRVQATAVNPLSSLAPLARGASAVFGHSQLAMETVPTTRNKPQVLYTTGSVSEIDFSDTKAGVKAAFHHSSAAVIAEVDDDWVHLRAVVADENDGFYDCANGPRYYHPRGDRRADEGIVALTPGDSHVKFIDPEVKSATYTSADSICAVLKPSYIIHHDLIDFYWSSHHRRKDPVHKYALHKSGDGSIEKEMREVVSFMHETTPSGCEVLVVASNHNEHVLRWMSEVDVLNEEPWNVDIFVELWSLLKDTIEFEPSKGVEHGDPFELWIKPQLDCEVRFLSRDEPYYIADIDVSNHGDKGINGSRGSRQQYAKVASKTIIGHGHSPGIAKGCYQVGTSDYIKRDYRKGPHGNANAHCVIYPNGKRQMIFIVNGKWRA